MEHIISEYPVLEGHPWFRAERDRKNLGHPRFPDGHLTSAGITRAPQQSCIVAFKDRLRLHGLIQLTAVRPTLEIACLKVTIAHGIGWEVSQDPGQINLRRDPVRRGDRLDIYIIEPSSSLPTGLAVNPRVLRAIRCVDGIRGDFRPVH